MYKGTSITIPPKAQLTAWLCWYSALNLYCLSFEQCPTCCPYIPFSAYSPYSASPNFSFHFTPTNQAHLSNSKARHARLFPFVVDHSADCWSSRGSMSMSQSARGRQWHCPFTHSSVPVLVTPSPYSQWPSPLHIAITPQYNNGEWGDWDWFIHFFPISHLLFHFIHLLSHLFPYCPGPLFLYRPVWQLVVSWFHNV